MILKKIFKFTYSFFHVQLEHHSWYIRLLCRLSKYAYIILISQKLADESLGASSTETGIVKIKVGCFKSYKD